MTFRADSALFELQAALGATFVITDSYREEKRLRVRATRLPDLPPVEFRVIADALEVKGYSVSWMEYGQEIVLEIKALGRGGGKLTNIVMFALTVISVFIFPQYAYHQLSSTLPITAPELAFSYWIVHPELWHLAWAAQFSFWLLAILLAHEFGHYIAGRRRGVRMTLPFFIPFPLSPFGTMGAIIKFKSPIMNRRDLIEIGAAGPLAGFVVALIAILVGLSQTEISGPPFFSFQQESLLMTWLGHLYFGEAGFTKAFDLAPAAFAGWAGLLVTALNLAPVSQLDGGHITYGLFGPAQKHIVRVALALMVAAGFYWSGWWMYAVLAVVFGALHPPTLDDSAPISRTAKIMGWASLILFVICVNPRPFG